jgi:hypothetical protein
MGRRGWLKSRKMRREGRLLFALGNVILLEEHDLPLERELCETRKVRLQSGTGAQC